MLGMSLIVHFFFIPIPSIYSFWWCRIGVFFTPMVLIYCRFAIRGDFGFSHKFLCFWLSVSYVIVEHNFAFVVSQRTLFLYLVDF